MNDTQGAVLGLIGKLKTAKVTKFAVDSDGMEDWEDDREDATLFEGANVVSSKRVVDPASFVPQDSHAVLLDLDVPAYLIPSSTPGHSHLCTST